MNNATYLFVFVCWLNQTGEHLDVSSRTFVTCRIYVHTTIHTLVAHHIRIDFFFAGMNCLMIHVALRGERSQ